MDPTRDAETAGATGSNRATRANGATRSGILGLRSADITERALVVGDPQRVGDLAAHLEQVEELGRSREYVTIRGRYRGAPVTVASHGVGASGAAVCFEELARAGVRRFVRAGTCGGIQSEVVEGDLVIGTAAVRDDGVSDRLVPPAWPAVADPALTLALTELAGAEAPRSHTGVVHTGASFHPSPVLSEPGWQVFHRAGALATEMEFAVLLVIAALHGAAAGGIFAVDGNLLTAARDMADYDPHRAIVRDAKAAMLRIALDALVADVA
jgi:uridine phosphorylase